MNKVDYEWFEYAEQMKSHKLSWHSIAKSIKDRFGYDISEETIRSQLRRKSNLVYDNNTQTYVGEVPNKHESMEYKSDGTYISDKLISIMRSELNSPESIIKAHGLDAGLWQVMSYKNNMWNALSKDDGQIVQCQSKLTVKPIVGGIAYKQLDRYFADKSFSNPTFSSQKYPQYEVKGEVLEICIPDLHAGLFSWRKETGEDYDIHIAIERIERCMADILVRCRKQHLSKIILVTLGDLLHVDNDKQETAKGTFLQSDGRFAKIFEKTIDCLIDVIRELSNIAPVEVIFCSGNHDRCSGYMALVAISKAFVKDNNVTFDTEPNPQKFRLIGNALVGWTHGDMPKKNMPFWLQTRAKKEFGQSKFVEVHAGHYHSQQTGEFKTTVEDGGVIVKYLPTICSSSLWEHQQGYPETQKTVLSFLWNEETGLRETWNSNI